MANPLDVLLQQAKNKIQQTASGLFGSAQKFVQQNPTPVSFVQKQFQPQINAIKAPIESFQSFGRDTITNNYLKNIQPAITGAVKLSPPADLYRAVSGQKPLTPMERIGTLGQTAVSTLGAIPDPTDIGFFASNYLKGATANAQKTKQPYSMNNVKAGLEAIRSGNAPSLGEAAGLKGGVKIIADLAELPIMVAGISRMTSKQVPQINEAVKLLQKRIQKSDVDFLGKVAEVIETKGGKVNLGDPGKDYAALAENVFGPDARTWSNQKIKNAFDLVLERIGTKPNRSGLGLKIQDVREGGIKPIGQAVEELKAKMNQRGFTQSVQEAGNIGKKVKNLVDSSYQVKPNSKLMGEAQALLQEGAKLDLNKVKDADQKVAATIQMAINQQKKNPEMAANLFNNLSEQGTQLGRGVQAFSLLQKMSPESIALSAASKIKEYNRTAVRKIPELTGSQVELISKKVDAIRKLAEGSRERNIAVNELSNTVNEFIPSSVADKFLAVWKAGLLTSPRTTLRNLVGNTIMGASEAIKDIPGSIADIGMSAVTGKRTLTPTLQGSSELLSKKTAQQVSDVLQLGYDASEDISKFDRKQITWGKNPIEQLLKKYTDVVFRSLGAQDKPFFNASMTRSLYQQAKVEAMNAGKAGDRGFIEGLVHSPTADMLKTAISDANIATFKDKNKISDVASAIKRTMGKNEFTKLAGEIIMPFTGVPSAVAGSTIAYSPIGLVNGAIKAGRVLAGQVPELQRQAAQEIGRGVVGTGLYGLGAYLMSKGLMTGQPKDATEANLWATQGKQANSVLIGGKWRSIGSIGPQNLAILAGAKLQEELAKPDGSIGAYAASMGKDQMNQTFLQGMSGPLNAITDPNRYGASYVGNTAASVIPNIVKDTAKAFDQNQREVKTVTDYLKQGIPGQRNTLIEKRDVLGNIVPQEPTGINAFIDLFNSKTPIDNTVVNELGRLSAAGTDATPSKMSASQTIAKKKVKLTMDQLNQLEAGVGEMLKPKLETLISSPVYQQLDDEHKAKAIDSLVADTRTKYKNINAKTLLGAGLDPNQYLDANGNLKTVSTEPIKMPALTGNKVIDDKLKASYKTAVTNQQVELEKLKQSNNASAKPEKKTYDYVDENGNYKTVDLTPIQYPVMSGNDVVDKRLKSAYYSQINAQINDVIKLEQAGQLTKDEMVKMVNDLNEQYTRGKTKSVPKPTLASRKIPKVKALKSAKAKKIKVPKLKAVKTPKVKTLKQRSINIKPLLAKG